MCSGFFPGRTPHAACINRRGSCRINWRAGRELLRRRSQTQALALRTLLGRSNLHETRTSQLDSTVCFARSPTAAAAAAAPCVSGTRAAISLIPFSHDSDTARCARRSGRSRIYDVPRPHSSERRAHGRATSRHESPIAKKESDGFGRVPLLALRCAGAHSYRADENRRSELVTRVFLPCRQADFR